MNLHFLFTERVVTAFRILFGVLLLLVLVLSLIPEMPDTGIKTDLFSVLAGWLLGDAGQGDKISHFVAYGVLGGTAVLARLRPFGRWLLAGVALIVFSGLMEFAQGFVSTRVPGWADMLANILGVSSGITAGLGLRWLAMPRHKLSGPVQGL